MIPAAAVPGIGEVSLLLNEPLHGLDKEKFKWGHYESENSYRMV